MRISTRQVLALAALAVALPATFASSASAAACDPATYPTPFLRFYGGTYNANTRFIELHVRPLDKTGVNSWSDPVYPFTVTVSPSNGAPKTFNVTNFARQQFPAKFTSKTQTTHVTTTYDEIHTTYPLPGTPVNTTCSRTISNTYKAPPKPKPPKRSGSTGGGGKNGQSEDRERDDDGDR